MVSAAGKMYVLATGGPAVYANAGRERWRASFHQLKLWFTSIMVAETIAGHRENEHASSLWSSLLQNGNSGSDLSVCSDDVDLQMVPQVYLLDCSCVCLGVNTGSK